jgi:hypothetical protein
MLSDPLEAELCISIDVILPGGPYLCSIKSISPFDTHLEHDFHLHHKNTTLSWEEALLHSY